MLIHATLAAAVLLALAAPVHADDPPADGKKVVLFVCEHGASRQAIDRHLDALLAELDRRSRGRNAKVAPQDLLARISLYVICVR